MKSNSVPYVFIPLGTCCSAAFVIANKLNQRKQAFPFDWIDISVENITKIIGMDIISFTKYLNEVQSHTQKHPDGTYFPHDIDYANGQFIDEVIDKYIRRFIKLQEVLNSGVKIVFLTVFREVGLNACNYGLLADKISSIRNNNIFISINLFDHDFSIGDHYNFYIPIAGNNLDFWEKEISEKIKEII